jgi:hypothetical protein
MEEKRAFRNLVCNNLGPAFEKHLPWFRQVEPDAKEAPPNTLIKAINCFYHNDEALMTCPRMLMTLICQKLAVKYWRKATQRERSAKEPRFNFAYLRRERASYSKEESDSSHTESEASSQEGGESEIDEKGSND